jgi:CubicO group peptidase (beta-lactamase class C family)
MRSTIGFVGQNSDILPRARPEDVGLSSERLARVGEVIAADIAAGKMPGAVLAIVRRGRLAFLETYGRSNPATGTPMPADAIFNIASMTKPVTALAALQLYEQGRLLIDDSVAKYLPGFASMRVAVMDEAKAKVVETVPAARFITIHDLMRHTSGLIYGGRGTTAVHKLYPEGSGVAGARMTGDEFVKLLTSLPLLHQPGAVWDYGFGLDVLGLVIERVTGMTLGEYFRSNIFEPLGMADTGFFVPGSKAARVAQGISPGDGPYLHDPRQPLKFECGGACLASTALDYMRFAVMLLNGGRFGDARVLARKTVAYMVSNHLTPEVTNLIANADPTRAGYGFGLGLAVRTDKSVVPMMGSIGEFNWPGAGGTNWWADPREDMAVVFMAVTPGPVRWHYRQLINALVYQALDD